MNASFPETCCGAQLATHTLALPAALTPVLLPAVAHLARADGVAVPAMLPVAVTGAVRPRCIGRRQIAYAVGVVVNFGMADIATGDTDAKRNMGVGTRHYGASEGTQCPGPLSLGEGRTGAIG